MLTHIHDRSKKEEEIEREEKDKCSQQFEGEGTGGAKVDALQQAGLEDKVWGENSPTISV